MDTSLPVNEIIPSLKDALKVNSNVVLQAPPGAGKTTVVPLELLGEEWLGGKKILMLEPRRLAARTAARRMANTLRQEVGQTVGYRVRMDNRVGAVTRVEVVTEGVLIRKIQSDPELSEVGLIVFDEFHERSLEADLGLALSLDIQEGLRNDLKILVMSATLDGDRIAKLLGNAPVISSKGRNFPVDLRFMNVAPSAMIEKEVSNTVLKALNEEQGSILVFLPGVREIKRTQGLLEELKLGPDILICPLYGMMSVSDQDKAIEKAPAGKIKIVLATSIAETSITIEGIHIVIDSGLQRFATFDLRTGMTRIVTSRVSRAAADQRTGRAGRLAEGVCYRLWSEASHRALKAYDEPEIKRIDLVQLALDLALWGIEDVSVLKWQDVPDKISLDKARDILFSLDALDEKGGITAHGRSMSEFSMHPRLSHMILRMKEKKLGMTALMVAALIDERDVLRLKPDHRTVDLRLRLEALLHVRNGELNEASGLGCDIRIARALLKQVDIWKRIHSIDDDIIHVNKAGLCLATAFPERMAASRTGQTGIYSTTGGRGAKLPNDDPLATHKFLSVGQLDLGGKDAKIFQAAPISLEEMEENFADHMQEKEIIEWDARSKTVKAEKKKMLNHMPIATGNLDGADKQKIKKELLSGIKQEGLECLPWNEKSRMLRKRTAILADFLPSLSDEMLIDSLEQWLGPYLDGVTALSALQKLDLYPLLKNILSWDQQQRLKELAPTHVIVPSGANIMIDYECDPPALKVKLQEMFGTQTTPAILGGKVKLSLHLLSPARRPLQITNDLEQFWKSSYHEIKKEMKGRYPKHPWPDNPLDAPATGRPKSRR